MPRLEARIDCLLFRHSFDAEFIEFNKKLNNLEAALKAVRDNGEL